MTTTKIDRPYPGDDQPDRDELAFRILPLREAAARLRTPEATLRYWRHLGTGPHSFKIGRRVMYDEDDLYRWINQQRDGGGPDVA
jgi:hypothetical protein